MPRKYHFAHIRLLALLTLFPLLLVCRSAQLPIAPGLHSNASSTPIASETSTEADFASHVEQLRKKLPSKEFSIVIQRPFVVIGDEPAEAVKEHAEDTVKWTVDKLKQDFF